MSNPSDIRGACAKVLDVETKKLLGTAFLIDDQHALTCDRVVKGLEQVTLRFPIGEYGARVVEINRKISSAILQIDTKIEDIIPLRYGFDVSIGDTARVFGYSDMLKGAGLFLEGRILDTNFTFVSMSRPSILLFFPLNIDDDLIQGFTGGPLIVGNTVVGMMTWKVRPKDTVNLVIFTKIYDILALFPKQVTNRQYQAPSLMPVTGIPGKPDVVIVSALDEELDYLYELPLEWRDPMPHEDGLTYRRGRLNSQIDIIVTTARSMGLTAAATVTAKALKEWKPAIAAMVGVCGGRKEKNINLGDIIVASECFHYQFGAFENGQIKRELRVENTKSQIIDLVEHLARRTRVLQEIYDSIPRGFKKPNHLLQCHIGPMASADLVVKDVEKFGEAVDADRKTIAVDMESYAFMRTARLANTRWSFVVKSVTDFADAEKDDEYREYAKLTSVHFLYHVINKLASGWA